MAFNFNKAIYEDSKNNVVSRSSDYQKIFNDDAPSMGYISSKAPCEFILVPPHASYGASAAMTSGGFRQDSTRGVVPTLGQYGIDWVMVYRKVGNDPDYKKRKDILAINMMEGPDGMTVQTERDWGKGYMSPMYKLREFLWRTGGGHKYNKALRRSEPTINVDTSTAKYKRAHELVPVDGNDLNSPLSKGVRTMFLQGFMVNNAGINYTVDEEGQPCWPRHKILMINQISAIKSREDARTKEGFYDVWFERADGINMDPEYIIDHFGDVSQSETAQTNWEAGFRHSDFAVKQKLVTFSSYPSGPAGIATYTCAVQNLSDRFGEQYVLPDEVLKKVRPFSDYILENNEKLQIQWLLELFPGDEWAFIEAGIIQDGSNSVAMGGFSVPTPAPTPVTVISTPVVQPAVQPPVARAPMFTTKPPYTTPESVSSVTKPKAPPIPVAPVANSAPTVPPVAAPVNLSAGGPDLSSQMKALMSKLQNNVNK